MKDIITDTEKLAELAERSEVVILPKMAKQMRDCIAEIKDTMRKKKLVSLSAVQIGYPLKIFCINFNGEIQTYVNPMMTDVSKEYHLSRETCASYPDKEYIMPRCVRIRALYTHPKGEPKSCVLEGHACYLYQHELHHLEGVTLDDVALELPEGYDEASEEERTELVDYYLDSLDIKRKSLLEEIEKDDDLKKVSDAIAFMQGVNSGEVKVEGLAYVLKKGEEKKGDNE